MRKEMRIGMAVISLLAMGFCVVVALRLRTADGQSLLAVEEQKAKDALATLRREVTGEPTPPQAKLMEIGDSGVLSSAPTAVPTNDAAATSAAMPDPQAATPPADPAAVDPNQFVAQPVEVSGQPDPPAALPPDAAPPAGAPVGMMNQSAGSFSASDPFTRSQPATPAGDPMNAAPMQDLTTNERYGAPLPLGNSTVEAAPFAQIPDNTAPGAIATSPGQATMAGWPPATAVNTTPSEAVPAAATGSPVDDSRYSDYRRRQFGGRSPENDRQPPPRADDGMRPVNPYANYNGGNPTLPAAEPNNVPAASSTSAQYDIYGRDLRNQADPVPSQPVTPPAGQPMTDDLGRMRDNDPPDDRGAAQAPGAGLGGPTGRDTYVVGPNDSYWTISQKMYGTGSYFKALEEHNRERYPYADKLRTGDVVSVPPVEMLQSKYADLSPKPRGGTGTQSNTLPVSAQDRFGGMGRTYTVHQGDTLFDIARNELGKATRWVEIYDLNRATLGDDFDYLAPGTQLRLPPARDAEQPLTTQSRDSFNR